jgi:hypothetical protein
MKNEIILYQPNDLSDHIEVRIDKEKDTIWLTQKQMGILFEPKLRIRDFKREFHLIIPYTREPRPSFFIERNFQH